MEKLEAEDIVFYMQMLCQHLEEGHQNQKLKVQQHIMGYFSIKLF